MRAEEEGGAAPRRRTARCACGSISVTEEYQKVFGVSLCGACRAQDDLITKSRAKQLYLLTDRDLSRLGSLRRDNPLKAQWNGMRLYLQSQVAARAVEKFGSMAGLEERRRELASQQMKKRKSEEAAEAKREEKRTKVIQDLKERIVQEWDSSTAGTGKGASDRHGDSAGTIVRTYENGMQLEIEEL